MPIKLNGATSGSVELDVPAAVGSDLQLTLPTTAGTLDRLERAGNILQVKETHLDTAFSVAYSASTDTDVTNLSVSLTPSATTNKVLIFSRVNFECNVDSHDCIFSLKRGSTFVGRPAAAGSRATGLQGSSMGYWNANNDSTMDNSYFHFLDSPSTTSSITYQVSFQNAAGSTMYVNRTVGDNDVVGQERITSSIVVMEVAG